MKARLIEYLLTIPKIYILNSKILSLSLIALNHFLECEAVEVIMLIFSDKDLRIISSANMIFNSIKLLFFL